MENMRIRYGRVTDRKLPKNTLVTVRNDDTIFFGISRCRMSADRFTRAQGVKLAKVRLDVAQNKVDGEWTADGTLRVHASGLFGQVSVEEIKKLLQYFDNVDTLSVPIYE